MRCSSLAVMSKGNYLSHTSRASIYLQWLKGTTTRIAPEDEAMYKSFLECVTFQGGDEGLECAREAIQEIESAERDCQQGHFGRPFQVKYS